MTDIVTTPPHDGNALLKVSRLEAGYGLVKVLKSVDISVGNGALVTLLGRNGMGKSTLVKTIMGIVSPTKGNVVFGGADVTGRAPHRVAKAGIGYVPEGREIFPNLTVLENLTANHRTGSGRGHWTLDTIFELFPRLKERAHNDGTKLSGGEQQMLAIGRALMTNPRLLILDEATEGLAPLVRKEIWDCLYQLKQTGLAMIVVDKNISALKRIADHHLVMSKGQIVWHGNTDELDAASDVVFEHIGV